MADGDYQIGIYQRTTGKYVVFDNTSQTNRVTNRSYEAAENKHRILRFSVDNNSPTATVNILNSSYAGWSASGTGAIALGDYVEYKLWATGDTTLRRQMYGVIVDMQGMANGDIQITVYDYSYVLENPRPYKTIFSGYRDSSIRGHTLANGALSFTLADADPVLPLADVAFAFEDITTALGDGTPQSDVIIWDDSESLAIVVAQAFIAQGDALLAARIAIHVSGTCSPDFRIALRADEGGEPSSEILAYVDDTAQTFLGAADGVAGLGTTFIVDSVPATLYPGRKYWITLEVINDPGCDIEVHREDIATTSGIIQNWLSSDDDEATWTPQAEGSLELTYYHVNYAAISPDKYGYNSSTQTLNIFSDNIITEVFEYYRGKVSYFYGTVDHEDICNALIEHNTGLIGAVSTNQDRTFGTFSTLGKSLGQAMRSLMDIFETSGTWDGYQHVYAHYLSGDPYTGTQRLKVSKRLKTTNDSARTFSYYADTSTDNEVRIMGKPDLRKSTILKPCSVTVIGKDASGNPLPCTRHDRALTGSLGLIVPRFTEAKTFYDETLATLDDVDKVAWAYLDSYRTNLWEGRIRVSGVFPDLFEISTAQDTYGSGKIITINYSPLGISATKFKVLSIIVNSDNTTDIQISNRDTLYDNRISSTIKQSDISESFMSPVGLVDNTYVSVFDDTAIAGATAYMALLDSSANPITGLERAECTIFTNTAYNLKTFHAVFEKWMGYSDSTHPIQYIRLYSAKTGGSTLGTYALLATGPPIRDERFNKWKSMRLHVDYNCKAS